MLCLTACGGKTDTGATTALVGTWSANEAEGSAYIFNEDGTGKWTTPDGLEMNFTYVDNGASVEITYEGSASAQIWSYTIDGSILSMTDSDSGSVLTYTHQ